MRLPLDLWTLGAPVLTLGRTSLPLSFRTTPLRTRTLLTVVLQWLARFDTLTAPLLHVLPLPPPLAKTTLPFAIGAVRRITVITITGRRPNLELVQFVPLGIGTIPIRNGKQLANAATNINWLWIIHGPIMNHSPSCVQYSRKTKVAGFPIRPYNSSLFSSLSHVVQKSPDLSASSQS